LREGVRIARNRGRAGKEAQKITSSKEQDAHPLVVIDPQEGPAEKACCIFGGGGAIPFQAEDSDRAKGFSSGGGGKPTKRGDSKGKQECKQ